MNCLSSIAALTACALAASVGPAAAQPVDPAQTERIRHERREIGSRHQAAVAACAKVFAANACLDRVRIERREALDRLRHEELVLDDARRKERAARRLEAIESKTSAADARQASEPPPLRSPKLAASQAAPRAGAAARAPIVDAPLPTPEAAAGDRRRSSVVLREPEAARAERVQQAERRRFEAQQHREKVAQRNAARDRTRPPAAGLPIPPAVAAPLPASAAAAAGLPTR